MAESVSDDMKELVELHERDFQKYSVDHQVYCVPVDDDEADRLIDQHLILHYLFGERLFFPNIPNPRRVLDCGYGRASWALAVAEMYGEAQVDGIDIYPGGVPDDEDHPDNLELYWGNLNHRLTAAVEGSSYDFIHSRLVAPGISGNRWPGYVREMSRLLKRGGWIQLVEYNYIIQSDAGLLTDDHALYKWGSWYRHVMQQDRDPRAGRSLRGWLDRAGLVDVREQTFHVPIGEWPTDPRQCWIGERMRENLGQMLDSIGLWPFTQRLGWTAEQVESLTDQAREEMLEPRYKLYIPLHVAWGRKR